MQVANRSGESGIEFENATIENYSIKFKDKKQRIIITFKIKSSQAESWTVFIGGTASAQYSVLRETASAMMVLSLYSSQRLTRAASITTR